MATNHGNLVGRRRWVGVCIVRKIGIVKAISIFKAVRVYILSSLLNSQIGLILKSLASWVVCVKNQNIRDCFSLPHIWKKEGMTMKEKGSTSEKRKYPPRLYPEGKSPLQKRSMHHNCTFSSFSMMKDYIGDDVFEDIRDNSQAGVLLKLMESEYVWCAKTVHHFLTHQLAIERRYEIWCLIEGSPLRFFLYEFGHITGLNCGTLELEDNGEVNHKDFWGELKVDPADGPNWHELVDALRRCRGWTPEKRKMLGLLLMIHVGIMGLARASRVPLEYAKKVFNLEAFEKFQWGRVGFKCLVDSIKVVSYERDSYATHGCVHVLYIWALESVKVLGDSHGNRKEGDNLPLLCWNGGRKRFTISAFLAKEKKEKKKLEVNYLVKKPLEEIYPFWLDEQIVYGEGEGNNKLLDNLLHDIYHDCVDETAWEDGATKIVKNNQSKKRKKVLEDSDDDFVESPPKKSTKKAKGDQVIDEANLSDCGERGVYSAGVVKLLEALSGKMDLMTTSFQGVDMRLRAVEEDVKALKKDANKNADEVESSTGDENGGEGNIETNA